MMNNYVVIGKNGQLGSQLVKLLADKARTYTHSEIDIKNPPKTFDLLDKNNPHVIFNACAYTNVDGAESEYEKALKGNSLIPQILANYCKEKDIPLIHYSTDYVYSGKGEDSNDEDALPSPINKYGMSKLEGEKRIIESGCKYLIFRTSWVYDSHNKNFLTTMLKLAKEREELSTVSDQIGAPTYAFELAQKSIEAFNNSLCKDIFPSGIYNLCNAGEASWYDFAVAIFKNAKKLGINLQIKNLNKINTSQYPTPAKRPLNSRLDCSKVKSILNIEMPDWENSLEKCMEDLVENTENTDKRPARY